MNENIDKKELSIDELLAENIKLQKENDKISKRLDRVSDQGDRQHKQFEKLNEQLNSYINVIDDHVISINVDKNRNIINVSTAFSNTFGFKEKEVIGKNFEFLLNKDDADRVDAELHDFVASKQPWHGELRIKNKSDISIWTETIITPNFDEDGLNGFTFISEDISKEKELKILKSTQLASKQYDQSMLEYMSSKSGALLQRTSNSISYVLWFIFATVVWAIVWANYAQLEELTRGSGKIIPSNQVKKVDNFDNAIIEKILVKEGDTVEKGQLLLKFNNIQNSATLEQNTLRLGELNAKAQRLELESKLIIVEDINFTNPNNSTLIKEEFNLYKRDMKQLSYKTDAMNEKIRQKNSELDEANKKYKHLQNNFELLTKELKIKEAMAKEKIISEVEYIQLQRQRNDLAQELNKIQSEIARANSSVAELQQNIQEVLLDFKNTAKKQYHEVLSEIARLTQTENSLTNILTRDEILSPVDGTIKKMYVNTIGEVTSAGATLLEIVPTDEKMIVEVKIAPENIAYLKLNQDAMIKFSAYDFNIYGGIKANITYISADTIQNQEDGKSYYIVHLKMAQDHILHNGVKRNVKVGMVADVDIIHGKKSVMDYILKPILKAKQNALTEK